MDTSGAATTKAEKKIEQHKMLLSISNNSDNDACSNVVGLCERFTVAGNYEAKLLASASAALGRIARATAELLQARESIFDQSKKLAKIT